MLRPLCLRSRMLTKEDRNKQVISYNPNPRISMKKMHANGNLWWSRMSWGYMEFRQKGPELRRMLLCRQTTKFSQLGLKSWLTHPISSNVSSHNSVLWAKATQGGEYSYKGPCRQCIHRLEASLCKNARQRSMVWISVNSPPHRAGSSPADYAPSITSRSLYSFSPTVLTFVSVSDTQ